VDTVATLTPSAFLDTVLSRRPRTAVFDCDGTLWSSNSGMDFMYWEIEQGLLPRPAADALLRRYDEYLAGDVSEVDMCGEMVTCHNQLRHVDIQSAIKRFAESAILPNIFPTMLELVQRLREQGCELWAVTSTWSWVVKEGLVPFGIGADRILGVEIGSRDGLCTSELFAVPTDEFKAEALVKAGLPHPDAVFGNSIHDLAMLEIARHPYAINPNQDLRAAAEQRNWTVFQP
jgi:phosphoserine phosphatase